MRADGAPASAVDDTVRLWDLRANRLLVVLGQHPADVLRVRFDSHADAVVSASEDGTIKVWDAAHYEQVARFSKQSDWTTALAQYQAAMDR